MKVFTGQVDRNYCVAVNVCFFSVLLYIVVGIVFHLVTCVTGVSPQFVAAAIIVRCSAVSAACDAFSDVM